ncbi:hypothetical protein pb186bvf_014127 [Paramecium bursaria]
MINFNYKKIDIIFFKYKEKQSRIKGKVVNRTEDHILIKIDECHLKEIDGIIKKIKKKDKIRNKDQNQKSGNMFKRRVIPFFMNQFYIYSSSKNFDVYKFLTQLKKLKKSKQKKFELGDLKTIFMNNNENVRDLWKEFLQLEANEAIDRNTKIEKNYKEYYRNYVSILKNELNKEEPYKNFLQKNDDDCQPNIPKQNDLRRQNSSEHDERMSLSLLIKRQSQSSQYQMSIWDDTFI